MKPTRFTPCFRSLLFLLVVPLASCSTSALHESQRKAALPSHEIRRTPLTLVGHGIADPRFDIYRFQGWLIPGKSPRQFDLYLPKDRTQDNAVIREVMTAGTKKPTAQTITASIDMRYTSNMLLTDPAYRKKTDLAIGESVSCKGKCVSVSLRERGAIHHWDAKLKLDWVKRDKTAIQSNNALYAATLPFDAAGYMLDLLIRSSDDGDFGLPP